jgi:hypothetical protein
LHRRGAVTGDSSTRDRSEAGEKSQLQDRLDDSDGNNARRGVAPQPGHDVENIDKGPQTDDQLEEPDLLRLQRDNCEDHLCDRAPRDHDPQLHHGGWIVDSVKERRTKNTRRHETDNCIQGGLGDEGPDQYRVS